MLSDVSALAEMAAQIPWPDSDAEQAVRERAARLAGGVNVMGRLAELAEWLAGAQAESPPHDLYQPRLVVLGEQDDAGAGAVVADLAGVGWHGVSIPRRVSFDGAVEIGAEIVDREVDAGADLLILGERGDASRISAATVISLLGGIEPVRLVGHRTVAGRLDDRQWMRDVVAVRDTRRRGAQLTDEPEQLLATIGGPRLTATTSFLLRAAERRTPVLLDGASVTAAALLARELAPRAIRWWQASHRSADPAQAAALDRLRLEPLIDLGARLDGGAGSVMAIPVLRAAVRLFAELPEHAAQAPSSEVYDDYGGDNVMVSDRSAYMGEDEGWLDQFSPDESAPDIEEYR